MLTVGCGSAACARLRSAGALRRTVPNLVCECERRGTSAGLQGATRHGAAEGGMNAVGGASHRGPPKQQLVELLAENEQTRVTRVSTPGGSVIRKEPLGPDRASRLRHEVAVLEALAD